MRLNIIIVLILVIFMVTSFSIGYFKGQSVGYYQRRTAEIEIGRMLYKRSQMFKQNIRL